MTTMFHDCQGWGSNARAWPYISQYSEYTSFSTLLSLYSTLIAVALGIIMLLSYAHAEF